jgi:hypothetical protein
MSTDRDTADEPDVLEQPDEPDPMTDGDLVDEEGAPSADWLPENPRPTEGGPLP